MKKSLSLSDAVSKLKRFMSEKRAEQFAKKMTKVHSNPKAFLSMLAGNKSMSDAQKVQSLKTYIRKHGRRSSTLD